MICFKWLFDTCGKLPEMLFRNAEAEGLSPEGSCIDGDGELHKSPVFSNSFSLWSCHDTEVLKRLTPQRKVAFIPFCCCTAEEMSRRFTGRAGRERYAAAHETRWKSFRIVWSCCETTAHNNVHGELKSNFSLCMFSYWIAMIQQIITVNWIKVVTADATVAVAQIHSATLQCLANVLATLATISY